MKTEEYIGQNLSKIERYKWKLQDSKGFLCWINKNNLFIDRSYQRNANESKIQPIARDWSWIACGAIVVANRDGVFYVIDGQHRVLAARKRNDIEELPCILFKTTEITEEAKGFLTAQTKRKAVTATEKFKAMVVLGNPAALLVNDLLLQSNITVSGSSNKGHIKCIGSLLDHANDNPELFASTWPLIVTICNKEVIHQRIVDGVMYISKNIKKNNLINDNEWKKRILKIGYSRLLEATAKASAYYAKGGSKVWAKGILDAINKGCRNHIELNESFELTNN